MKEPKEERWHQLCEQAATERDPERLLKLVTEVNQLLKKEDEEKETTVTGPPSEFVKNLLRSQTPE